MSRQRPFKKMYQGKIGLLLFAVLMWAIICAGFTYETVQRERQTLYGQYQKKLGTVRIKNFQQALPGMKNKALEEAFQQTYRKELFELYWIFTPFFWGCITFSGYIVAIGFLLPVHWDKTLPK